MLEDEEKKGDHWRSDVDLTCSTIVVDNESEDSILIDIELNPMPIIVIDIFSTLNCLQRRRRKIRCSISRLSDENLSRSLRRKCE